MPDFIDEPSEAETPAEMAAQRAALDAKRDARKPAILAAVGLVRSVPTNADTQACLDAVVAWCRGEGTMQAVVSCLVATERLWSTDADSVQIAAQAARYVAGMVLDDDGDLAEATACVRDEVARAVAAAHVEAGHATVTE